MSLHPEPLTAVPEETARVARAAFPTGNSYMRIGDALGRMYDDDTFAALFSSRGQPAEAPWRRCQLDRTDAIATSTPERLMGCFLQAAKARRVISCQLWNRNRTAGTPEIVVAAV